jgi:hypothetical protein
VVDNLAKVLRGRTGITLYCCGRLGKWLFGVSLSGWFEASCVDPLVLPPIYPSSVGRGEVHDIRIGNPTVVYGQRDPQPAFSWRPRQG